MVIIESKNTYIKPYKRSIGKGGEGTVYLCYDKKDKDGPFLVMKTLFSKPDEKRQGIKVNVLREIKILKELNHPNIIDLKDVFVNTSHLGEVKVRLIYNYMDTNLQKIIEDKKTIIMVPDVRYYMTCILRGLQCLHNNGVLHRDLKPENVLVNAKGQVMISDFGSSKHYGLSRYQNPYSPDRGTRWYRAPELLMGATEYGPAADMWSVGCIFYDLMKGSPLFPANSELEQLSLVYSIMGTPRESDWKGVTLLPKYQHFKEIPPIPLERQIPSIYHGDGFDLLTKLLSLNPNKRLSCEQALAHPFFKGPTSEKLSLPSEVYDNEKEMEQKRKALK